MQHTRSYLRKRLCACMGLGRCTYTCNRMGIGTKYKIGSSIQLRTRHGISNQEILDYVLLNYGPVEVKVGARRPGDPDCLIADAELAHQVLQWKPNYSTINQIIDSAWQWYNRA
jgi:UDP-glucose 4-epimerase